MRKLLFIVFIFLCLGTQAQYINHRRYVVDEVESSYRETMMFLFQNDEDDEVPGNSDWTNVGPVTFATTVSPPAGTYHAVSIGGTTRRAEIDSEHSPFNSSFTVSFWLYPTSSSSNLPIFGNGNSSSGFYLQLNSTGQDFDIFTDGNESNCTNFYGSAPSINDWIHFCVTWNNTTATLEVYIDNVSHLDVDNASTVSSLAGTWIFYMGIGYAYDFRVFDEILGATDRTWVYEHPGQPLPE